MRRLAIACIAMLGASPAEARITKIIIDEVKPLADDLAKVDSLTDKKGLIALLGTLQREGVGGIFGAGVG